MVGVTALTRHAKKDKAIKISSVDGGLRNPDPYAKSFLKELIGN